MNSPIVFLVCLAVFLLFAAWRNKLTVAGCVTAALIGCCIFGGFGMPGIAIIGSFFMLAVFATQWDMAGKKKLGAAEDHEGRRNAGQVMANGGMAGILGLFVALGWDNERLAFLMLAAALSSATADTLSSELGTLYGRKFFNIVTFKPGRKGENGVVSFEGTIIGIAASTIIAVIAYIETRVTLDVGLIVLAGTAGNFVDSCLGATLERRGRLSNNAVNFLNTAAAAVLTWLLKLVF